MDKALFSRADTVLPPDIGDELEVFVYKNLSTIISPHPEVLLTPSFRAALVSALNNVGPRPTNVQKDLVDIISVFIIANAGRID